MSIALPHNASLLLPGSDKQRTLDAEAEQC
jgi:hypothetical protein